MRKLLLLSCTLLLTGCTHGFHEPLSRASSRPQLLTFGLHVTPDPADNPIDPPERFTGYHTGLDYEIFDDEMDKDVAVFAVCAGEILASTIAEGYGGVIVEKCMIDGEEVTVLYGHVEYASAIDTGAVVEAGQEIAILGDHDSAETGDTRKHLHLGIHKGPDIEYLGYVQTEEELSAWIDPADAL